MCETQSLISNPVQFGARWREISPSTVVQRNIGNDFDLEVRFKAKQTRHRLHKTFLLLCSLFRDEIPSPLLSPSEYDHLRTHVLGPMVIVRSFTVGKSRLKTTFSLTNILFCNEQCRSYWKRAFVVPSQVVSEWKIDTCKEKARSSRCCFKTHAVYFLSWKPT